MQYFGQEKLNLVREKSVKSQGILFLHEGGHPVSKLMRIVGCYHTRTYDMVDN